MQSTDPGEMAVEGLQSENEVCIIILIKDVPRKDTVQFLDFNI